MGPGLGGVEDELVPDVVCVVLVGVGDCSWVPVVDAPEVEDEGAGEPVDVEVCVDPVVGVGS